jgi:ferredoxin
MADISTKYDDNAPGKYYVDEDCISCGACVDAAPDNFAEAEDGDHYIVSKQPESSDEVAACDEAISECPSDCIGDDGE